MPTNKCFDTKYIIDEEDKAAIEELELMYSDKQDDNFERSTRKRNDYPEEEEKEDEGLKEQQILTYCSQIAMVIYQIKKLLKIY